MDDERQRLESLLRAIHTYQVDASSNGVVGTAAEEYLNEDDFLLKLYVCRDVALEARIIQQISVRQNVVCIFGERGCGKTSMLRSLRATLNRLGKRVVLIDIKVLWEQIAIFSDEPMEATSVPKLEILFSRVLRDALLRELWPGLAERDRLHAWLLAGPDGEDLSRFTTLDSVISEVRHIARITSAATHKERAQAIFEAIQNSPREFRDVVRDLLSVVSASQLARCYARMYPKSDLVVLYDNVDRIPVTAPQTTFLRLVNDFQLASAPLTASVIGIRPENLRAAGARPNRAGDIWNVVFLESSWPGFSLLPAETEHLQSILVKRHEYFSSLAGRFHTGQGSLFLTSTGRLHKQLLSEIARESLLLLVNGNLRAANGLYADFMPFLLGLESRFPEHFDKALEAGEAENHLQTLMYYWIRECGTANDIPVHDFERDAFASGRMNDVAASASLEHLIMATILNFHRDAEKMPQDGWSGWPLIHAVVNRVTTLGFSRDDVEDSIENLCGEPGEPSEVLAIEDRRKNRRVMLTPSGRHLLLEVYNKVGFIWAPAMRWYNRDGSRRTSEYFGLSTNERISVLSDYLEMRARRHLRLMVNIRRVLGNKGLRWLPQYRQWFGVGGSLQIERLLRSASKFYSWNFERSANDPFNRILTTYTGCLRALEEQENGNKTNSEVLWKRIARRAG